MMWSEVEDDTFYVFMNGRLVFKEWRPRNLSALIDVRCEPRYFRESRTTTNPNPSAASTAISRTDSGSADRTCTG
jgi:hypothetical protein